MFLIIHMYSIFKILCLYIVDLVCFQYLYFVAIYSHNVQHILNYMHQRPESIRHILGLLHANVAPVLNWLSFFHILDPDRSKIKNTYFFTRFIYKLYLIVLSINIIKAIRKITVFEWIKNSKIITITMNNVVIYVFSTRLHSNLNLI